MWGGFTRESRRPLACSTNTGILCFFDMKRRELISTCGGRSDRKKQLHKEGLVFVFCILYFVFNILYIYTSFLRAGLLAISTFLVRRGGPSQCGVVLGGGGLLFILLQHLGLDR